jgi:hypothetical protein
VERMEPFCVPGNKMKHLKIDAETPGGGSTYSVGGRDELEAQVLRLVTVMTCTLNILIVHRTVSRTSRVLVSNSFHHSKESHIPRLRSCGQHCHQ